MRRLILTIQIAACSGSSVTPDATEAPPAPHAAIVHGAPGSAIDIVAATADGRAAVTQDAAGNTRLWPTLDGSAEPIVLRITAAAELAVVRDGDTFLVASLDAAGGLQLVRVARDGTPHSRATFGRELAVDQLAVTSNALLALRADQTIAVIGGDGALRGQLATPPGERAIALVTRGDRAIAVVERGHDQHARALDVEKLEWGDALATFRTSVPRFALSPNGEMLAMVTSPGVVVEVDLAANKQYGLCAKNAGVTQLPLGYIDDATIACLTFSQVSWYPVTGSEATFVHAAAQPELVAFGGEQQISGEGLALGIARRNSMQYLGYQLTDPSTLHASPLGLTILRTSSPALVLDRALAVRREIVLEAPYSDALPLDATHVLRSDVVGGKNSRLSIVDTVAKRSEKVADSTDYRIQFDGAAKLLAVEQATHVALLPYDPTHHRFGEPTLLDGAPGRVYLTDPQLADGIAAVVVETVGGIADTVRVREYEARDIDRGGMVTPARSYDLGGEVITVDRAARAYLTTGTSLQSYVGGGLHAPILVAKLALAGRPVIAPNAEATAALVLGDNHMIMIESDGHVRWSVPAEGAIDAGWVDGEPFVRFGSGLATVDARTGVLRDRRCGWQFALVA
ncbi:MAG TPA: hypothetical protein VFQ65_29580, partial [Kofleriaceae bacterium]|nr:hypothetical protein [Kofleriaceae bacterium]